MKVFLPVFTRVNVDLFTSVLSTTFADRVDEDNQYILEEQFTVLQSVSKTVRKLR